MSSSRQQRPKEMVSKIEYAKISGLNIEEGYYITTVSANWILEREHRIILSDTDGTRYLSEETKWGQIIFWPPKINAYCLQRTLISNLMTISLSTLC